MLLLKHGSKTTRVKIKSINSKVEINSLELEKPKENQLLSFSLNDIGTVSLQTAEPLCYDRYARNRYTGGFILIDPANNATLGAGMLKEPPKEAPTQEYDGYMI